MPNSLSLKDLLRLDRQLHRDQSRPLRQLQARDRELGARLQQRAPVGRLLAWLNETAEADSAIQRLSGIESAVGFWLALLALVFGAVTMSGLLMVDRDQPVNVLLLLTVFVGAQWLLLLFTLVIALLGAWHSNLHLPLESLNPARWLFRRHFRHAAEGLRLEQINPVLRLLFLTWGQLFGVFFNAGALLAFLIILLVVDRSFGWSSTLDLTADGLHRALHWLSWPWASWLPEAVVNEELVRATRYQSLQNQFGDEQVAAMRGWWPFLFAAITGYGLVPRLLLWIVFYSLYRRLLRQSFVGYPGARLVLDRMSAPLVHTQANDHESSVSPGGETAAQATLPSGRPRLLVNWSGALGREAEQTLSDLQLEGPIREAGIDLEADRDLLQQINTGREDVVILVKSWEPPLSELGDFLHGISPKLDCYLFLLPLANRPVKMEELSDWQLFARQKHHPRLTVIASDGGEAST